MLRRRLRAVIDVTDTDVDLARHDLRMDGVRGSLPVLCRQDLKATSTC